MSMRARTGRRSAISVWAANGKPTPSTMPITMPTSASAASWKISREDQPLRRTEALHGGDGALARGEKARHRIADPDAAHQQGREADQAEKLRQPIEPEANAAAGIGQALHPPAVAWIARADSLDDRGIGFARRQAQAILPAQQAARLHQRGVGQRIERH